MSKIKGFTDEGIRIRIELYREEKILNLFFIGEIYIADKNIEERLENYFEDLYDNITEHVKYINMDFIKLSAISSYGIRILINWLKKFYSYNETDDNKYIISIIFDHNIEWQETTFASLKEIFSKNVEYKEK